MGRLVDFRLILQSEGATRLRTMSRPKKTAAYISKPFGAVSLTVKSSLTNTIRYCPVLLTCYNAYSTYNTPRPAGPCFLSHLRDRKKHRLKFLLFIFLPVEPLAK